MFYEVGTRLTVKDDATAALQRFVAMLREVQAQVDASLAGLRRIRSALAPSMAALSRQRESLAMQREGLAMVTREAELRAGITVETKAQAASMLAARRASLSLANQELATQRSIRGSIVPALRRGGSGLFWGGAGIVGAMGYATQQAMNFNQTALETDVALGGYARSAGQRAADINALKAAAMAGSEATGFFSAQAILEGLKRAASSGARPLVERMGMGVFTSIAPSLSRYMDVVGRLKGESADQAAMEAIRTAHMFGAYTPAAISRILNAQAALALLMPDKMSTATTTLAYAAPSGVNLAGIPQEAILALVATADQSGLGRGRAGARLKDYIETLGVTQSKQRETAKRLLGLGGAVGANGSVDLMRSFEILSGDATRMGPQAYRNAVRTAFGSPGAIIAAMFGDESKQAMFEANRKVIEQAVQRGDLDIIQNILKGGPRGQEALMTARLQNDIIQFGQYGLPIAVRFFDAINPRLKQFSNWMSAHPADAQRLFDNMLKLGGGMVALGAAFRVTAGIIEAIRVIRTLAGAMKALGAAGTAIQSSPLWGVFSALANTVKGGGGALIAGATISMQQQSNAKAAYDAMAHKYGARYANYLLHGDRGGSFEGWPWNFDRVGTPGGLTFPSGALSPRDWEILNPTKLSDTIRTSGKTSSDRVVEGLNRVESAVRGIALTINVPAATNHPQTVHQNLFGPHRPTPASHGYATSPAGVKPFHNIRGGW